MPVYRLRWKDNTSFTNDQRAWLAMGIASMQHLGFTVLWITDNTPVDCELTHWPDDNSVDAEPAKRTDERCKNAGRFTPALDGKPALMEFDPVGLGGDHQWLEAGAHECGHLVGLPHYTGRFPAIMKPELYSGLWYASDLAAVEQMKGQIGPKGPTRPDFDAYDALHTK